MTRYICPTAYPHIQMIIGATSVVFPGSQRVTGIGIPRLFVQDAPGMFYLFFTVHTVFSHGGPSWTRVVRRMDFAHTPLKMSLESLSGGMTPI